VRPVGIADLEQHAGHFMVDEENYASIAVSRRFLQAPMHLDDSRAGGLPSKFSSRE
jgi:hypothetical protein